MEDLGYVGNRPNKWEGVPADDTSSKNNLKYEKILLFYSSVWQYPVSMFLAILCDSR